MTGMDTPQRDVRGPRIAVELDELDATLVALDDTATELSHRLNAVRSGGEAKAMDPGKAEKRTGEIGASPVRERLQELNAHAQRIHSRLLEVMGELEC